MGLDADFYSRQGVEKKEIKYYRKHWTLHEFICSLKGHDPHDVKQSSDVVFVLSMDDILEIKKAVSTLFDYYPPEGEELVTELLREFYAGNIIHYKANW